ncbi:MAG: ribosome-associated translation inhibitor RaiA [Bacteroidales bacterium]
MKVDINSVHFRADVKLETFIQEKVNKLEQYFDGILGSDVMLKLDNADGKDNKIAEVKLKVPGEDLFAKKQAKSFEEATDQAVSALRKQLIKYKDKLKNN